MEQINKDILSNWIDRYLEYLVSTRGYSASTQRSYSITLKQMLKHSDIIYESDKIVLDIVPYRLTITGNAKKTISRKLSSIRSFVSFIYKYYKVKITIKGAESIKTPQKLPKPIEQDYITEVLKSADIMQKALISLLYGAGLRIGEVEYLKVESIKRGWVEVTGKGNKTRQIPLPPAVESTIQNYLALYPANRWLFEKEGKRLKSSQLRYIVSKLFASHGIYATPHQLRHSFATHLLNSGARISDVSQLLGHSSMVTTQIYTKLSSSAKLNEYKNAHPLG